MSIERASVVRTNTRTVVATLALVVALVGACTSSGLPSPPADGGPSSGAPTTRPATASFAVRQLAIAPGQGEIVPGAEVTIVATVENAGAQAGTFEADLTVDGVSMRRQSVAIPAGGSSLVEFRIPAGTPGRYDVHLAEAQLAFDVLGPAAVEVTSIAASPNPAEAGDRVAVTVMLVNDGRGATPTVKLMLDRKVLATKRVAVPGGSSTTVTFSIKAPKAGRHTLAVGDRSRRLVVWAIGRPTNGKVLTNRISGGRGRLTVENGNDRDALLVLARTSAPKKTVLAIYIRAGRSATVKGVRDGTYIAYFSLGKRFDTASKAFTTEADRSRFEDTVRFKTTRSGLLITYSVWTLTLQPVVGGNAPTQDVGEGDFPGVP